MDDKMPEGDIRQSVTKEEPENPRSIISYLRCPNCFPDGNYELIEPNKVRCLKCGLEIEFPEGWLYRNG